MAAHRFGLWLQMISLLSFISCQSEHNFLEEKVFAGGIKVSAHTLNLGREVYMDNCVSCHGVKGDGKGVSSKGLYPPPRNFNLGIFKFGSVISGDLPTDDDLKRIIRHGLKGTAMWPWDVEGERLDAVVQYIKTFAPAKWEGANKAVGKPIVLKENPYTAQTAFATARGREVYHLVANCQTCHRAYVDKKELNEMSMKLNGTPMDTPDPESFKLKLQESDYGVSMLPPDFSWHEVRSASTVDELAARIAAGVGGTAMPSWKDTVEDDDIWAMAYYVRSLMDLRGTEGRQKLMSKLDLESAQ